MFLCLKQSMEKVEEFWFIYSRTTEKKYMELKPD